MEKYDVIIIGGGIAGLYTTQLLRKYNLKICLIDAQEDILSIPFHTLGSFLNVKDCQLSNKCISSKISKGVFHSKHINSTKYGISFILDKVQIHRELLKRLKDSNVKLLTSVNITKCKKGKNNLLKHISDDKNNKYFAKIFIDCSGITGVLTKKLGLQDPDVNFAKGVEYNVQYFDKSDTCHFFVGKLLQGGYAWIFPKKDNRAIFGYASLYEVNINNCEEILNSLFKVNPYIELVKKDNNKLCSGVIPITSVKTKFVYKNVVGIGDSVSQVNPIVGEGYKFIIEASKMASQYIYKAIVNNNIELLHNYEKEWGNKFLTNYIRCKKLQNIGNWASKSDFLSDLLVLFLRYIKNSNFTKLISGDINLRYCLPI